MKKGAPWRSARNIRDELNLKVSEHQVQRIILKAGLGKENLKRVKAIIRFGLADYSWYAKAIGITLIWARRVQTKGQKSMDKV